MSNFFNSLVEIKKPTLMEKLAPEKTDQTRVEELPSLRHSGSIKKGRI